MCHFSRHFFFMGFLWKWTQVCNPCEMCLGKGERIGYPECWGIVWTWVSARSDTHANMGYSLSLSFHPARVFTSFEYLGISELVRTCASSMQVTSTKAYLRRSSSRLWYVNVGITITSRTIMIMKKEILLNGYEFHYRIVQNSEKLYNNKIEDQIIRRR